MRVIIATGGSGGHIYPALALADKLMEDSNNEILFVGCKNKMEQVEIPNHGYRFIGLDVLGMNGGIVNKVKATIKLTKTYFRCRKIIAEYKPDIVVGFGNYTSVSIIFAAKHMHIPTMIHEQNSYAGKANKLLAKHVDCVVGCYDENKKDLKAKRVEILGNPRASLATDIRRNINVLTKYNLDINKKTAVIFMGSLGSESVNNVLINALDKFANKEYQVLIITGKKHFDSFPKVASNNIKVVAYADDLLDVMAVSDVVVCRAGATTCSEVCVIKIATIMIPSPYVPNNHQYYNALALANKNAAVLLEEKDLDENSLVENIDSLMNDDNKRLTMQENASKLSTPKASENIVKLMKELVK